MQPIIALHVSVWVRVPVQCLYYTFWAVKHTVNPLLHVSVYLSALLSFTLRLSAVQPICVHGA